MNLNPTNMLRCAVPAALEAGQKLAGGSDADLAIPDHLFYFLRADAVIFRDPQDHGVIRIISGFLYNIRVLIRDRFPLRALCFFSLRIRPGIDLPLFFRYDLFSTVVRLFRICFRGHNRKCFHSGRQTPRYSQDEDDEQRVYSPYFQNKTCLSIIKPRAPVSPAAAVLFPLYTV